MINDQTQDTISWIADWCIRAGLLDPDKREQLPGEWQYIPGTLTRGRRKFLALKGWALRESLFESLIEQIDDYVTECRATYRYNKDPMFGIRSVVNVRRAVWFVSEAHEHRLQSWVDDLDEILAP